MATNRFNPRNNLEALTQRQRDSRVARGLEVADETIRWNPTTQPVRNEDPWLNEYIYNLNTWGTNTGRTTTATRYGNAATGTNQWWTDPPRRTPEQARIDRLRDEAVAAARIEEDRRREEQRRIEREEAAARAIREQEERRATRLRSFQERTPRAKAEKRAKLYIIAMALGSKYKGKTYSYTPLTEAKVGVWLLEGVAVATICLDEIRLKSIFLPEDIKLHNKTRFLWRMLGLQAIRDKATTVVHTGRMGKILKSGEQWELHPSYLSAYIAEPIPRLKQEHLFNDPQSIFGSTTRRTKPVKWQNIHGTEIYAGIIYAPKPGGGNQTFDLNYHIEPAVESEVSDIDSHA